tara:strand:- start:2065 stop:2892 length:828 start_codon:yes stop_codon:yes gene_type:complete
MKIIAGIIVFEEEDFIRETLTNLYLLCDKIIIVEGAHESVTSINNIKRSQDNTIQYIKDFDDPENKIEYYEYNGISQGDHRNFALQKAVIHKPDWYLQGDGDEIFHEKGIEPFKKFLKTTKENSINPVHKLFWNDLMHYEYWTPTSRFFKLTDLDLNKVVCPANFKNDLLYDGKIYFNHHETDIIYIYHPSYCKNNERQLIKWKHRAIDDKIKFPHIIHENGLISRNVPNIFVWKSNLMQCPHEDLPKCLQSHPRAGISTLWFYFLRTGFEIKNE